MHGVLDDTERARGTSTPWPAAARSACRARPGASRQASTADPEEVAPRQHHTALQGAHVGAHARRHDTIAHAVRVMRGPYGGPLFASLVWPYQTGYSSEAIDIPYVVSPKKGAYSKYNRCPVHRPFPETRSHTSPAGDPQRPPLHVLVYPPLRSATDHSAGACAACVLLDLFSIETSPLHVKCNMESPPTACLRPAAGPPHGEAGRRPAPAPRERTREGATGEGLRLPHPVQGVGTYAIQGRRNPDG